MTKEELIEGVARALAPWANLSSPNRSEKVTREAAQAVIDYLSPMMREVVDDLTAIELYDPMPNYQGSVASKALASLECWREKGGEIDGK